MSVKNHHELVGNDIHHPFRWEFENETERTTVSGLTVNDLYCLAIQKDNNSAWMLINHSPTTWKIL